MSFLIIFFILLLLKTFVKLTNIRCKSKVCLMGKTALITGGSSGIGLQLAKELASRGCTIIIAGRRDASDIVENIIQDTNNANIYYKMVDFASFESVRSFAKELKKDINKLDILVNNAGILHCSAKLTRDGLGEIVQVNYFSHFLLTHLLLDLLLKSQQSRIIFTNSIGAYFAYSTESTLKSQNVSTLNSNLTYVNSKLAGAIMSKMLAKKLEGTSVTSNVCHPGICKTSIWNKAGISLRNIPVFLSSIYCFIFGKDIDEEIQTLLHLACAQELKKVSGKFFMECRSVWQPRKTYNQELCTKIWDMSERILKIQPDEKIERIIERYKFNE